VRLAELLDPTSARSYRRGVAAAVGVATLLRLRFVFEPLVADEGGALSAARDWAAGGALYERVWQRVPQGWMLVYRVWDALPFTNASSARWLAVLFGAAMVVAVAAIASTLRSPRDGVLAAWALALASSAPVIEGYTANGEVLTMGLSLPALALIVQVVNGRRNSTWLMVAGLLGGAAVTLKQSAFDVTAAFGVWSLIMLITRRRPIRTVVTQLVLYVGGLAVVLGASVLHGTRLGWDRYWYAIAGFRLGARSAVSNTEWWRLGLSILVAVPALGTLVAVIVIGLRGARLRSALRRPHWLLLALWSGFVFAGFASGGNFHRHYFLLLAGPLALAAGLAADAAFDRPRLQRAVRLTGAVAVVAAVPFVVVPRFTLGSEPYDNQAIAAWIDDVREADGAATLYAFCASAAIYVELDTTPPYPYLWADHVRMADGAQQLLADYLTGPDAPDFVARFQDDDSKCDVDGLALGALTANYEPLGRIGHVDILRRSDVPVPSVLP